MKYMYQIVSVVIGPFRIAANFWIIHGQIFKYSLEALRPVSDAILCLLIVMDD